MRILFIRSDKPRERILADAFVSGALKRGEDAVQVQRPEGGEFDGDLPPCDMVCFVGVKSVRLFKQFWKAGVHTLMLDKGYVRTEAEGGVKGWKYWRVAIDGHHPTHYLGKMKVPPDRWRALRLEMKPWRREGKHIVFAGSSAKYHEFYEMDDPTKFAEKYITRLYKELTQRPIVYRPKPSWEDACAVHGSTFSYGKGTTIQDVLRGAHCLVTHGSNAVFEAVLEGIPCIVMGEAVAKPISTTNLDKVETPYLATDAERLQWASNLAYCQWTLGDFQSGEAWSHIKDQLLQHCS